MNTEYTGKRLFCMKMKGGDLQVKISIDFNNKNFKPMLEDFCKSNEEIELNFDAQVSSLLYSIANAFVVAKLSELYFDSIFDEIKDEIDLFYDDKYGVKVEEVSGMPANFTIESGDYE